jgi:hypothetical protein
MNKASIIVDASKYIQDLKQKVEGLNSELGSIVESSTLQMDEQPKVLFLVLLHKFFSYIKKMYSTSTRNTQFLYILNTHVLPARCENP